MQQLGLTPTQRSGGGWIEKEDGYNDFVLCQHKSTDSGSYSIKQDDLRKLEYHALVEKKLPLFVLQFLQDDSLYLVIKPENLLEIVEYLTLPKSAPQVDLVAPVTIETTVETPEKKVIKSSNKENYWKLVNKEKEKKYGNVKNRK